MKYAKIYFNIKKNAEIEEGKEYLNDGSYMLVMAEDEELIEKAAIEGTNDATQTDNVPYEYEIKYLSALEYNEIKLNDLELKIKNAYRKSLGDDKNISIREYSKRMKDIDEYNKALEYYSQHESIKTTIRRIVDLSKLTLKEFDEYVEKIYQAIGTEEYSKLIEELKSK